MVVSELAGGQPPSPLAAVAHPEQPHPAGTVTLAARSRPASPQPPGPEQQQQARAWDPPAQHAAPGGPADGGEAMQLDCAPLSRSHSPALSVPALRAPAAPEQQASGFVPLSELGGSGASSQLHDAAVEQQRQQQQQQAERAAAAPHHAGRPPLDPHLPLPPRGAQAHEAAPRDPQPQPSCSSLEEPSSRPDRPPSGTGYESGDDMDVLAMRPCVNCTGTLWGHICMVRRPAGRGRHGAVMSCGTGGAGRGPRCVGAAAAMHARPVGGAITPYPNTPPAPPGWLQDCGHMPAHDADIFQPTVASATALHRPRLQVRRPRYCPCGLVTHVPCRRALPLRLHATWGAAVRALAQHGAAHLTPLLLVPLLCRATR